MAHVQIARHQHALHRLGQIQQTQQVAARAARATNGLGRRFVSEPKLFDQALQTLGFFQRVEVFALNVFDERHGRCRFVGHVAHQHRHALQARQLAGPKAPFARDDLVLARVLTVLQLAHQNRLHDALGLDGFGQFVQSALVHAGARLVHTGHHLVQLELLGKPLSA